MPSLGQVKVHHRLLCEASQEIGNGSPTSEVANSLLTRMLMALVLPISTSRCAKSSFVGGNCARHEPAANRTLVKAKKRFMAIRTTRRLQPLILGIANHSGIQRFGQLVSEAGGWLADNDSQS